jgi:uncharacterized protein YcnI
MLSCLKATAVACAVLSASPVSAHTVADPNAAVSGSYARTAFRVTHGCKGSPTVAVTIRLPEAVLQAKPMPKPGWTIDIKTRPLDPPVEGGHGTKIHTAVAEVTWRGGTLDDAHFDEFVLNMRLPDRPGETLYFPTTQVCAQGRYDWSEIPAAGQKWNELSTPAPFVILQKRAEHAR